VEVANDTRRYAAVKLMVAVIQRTYAHGESPVNGKPYVADTAAWFVVGTPTAAGGGAALLRADY